MTIQGAVNARLEAVLRLRVRGPAGTEADVDAVVDTGYTGSLSLPLSVVEALGLIRRSGVRAVLADGSSRRFETFAAEVSWGGSWQGVVVSVFSDESLIGMGLLAGHALRVEVIAGGAVTVIPLTLAGSAFP